MKYSIEADEELGPGLLFDRAYQGCFHGDEGERVLLDGLEREAGEGYCCFLRKEGVREFAGKVEIIVDEPPPEIVQYATASAKELWLRAPTGRFVLSSVSALLSTQGLPCLEFPVPPSDYAVDLYGFDPHRFRAEQSQNIPGGPNRWTRTLNVAAGLFALVSLTSLTAAFTSDESGPGTIPLAFLAVAPWAAWLAAYFLSGESKRRKVWKASFRDTLDLLPPIPDYMVVLRSAFVPPPGARGGGIIA